MKRLFDILFSLIALLVFSIPSAIIILLLLFREKHSIFFRQERIGQNKRSFQILKFQSMVAEKPTRTGKIIRKTGLDEWPQFINVLKGEMSIVGPRALTQNDIVRLGWDDEYHIKRWNLKPGISGYAQLFGGQHRKTSWFWDVKYIKENNVFMDLGVLIASFLINIFGKTRVRRILFNRKDLK
ncbi:MAG: sugar transferase [Bacteroidia bacterium]|nr:sugar transferase [Bacteroidia bacterium]NNJ55447.1 sugar transferase [Bacteroidia bacterium]